MRQEVESLLVSADAPLDFLQKPIAEAAGQVLPFRNLKPDPQTDFLGFSLADAITTKLGYVSALSVRPSSSVDKYRNQMG